MWIGSTLAGLGGQLTIVAIMLHMYELTGSTFAVAMIAVAGLVPMIVAGLYGGMLADAFDRRRVALIAATVTFASTALLAALTWAQLRDGLVALRAQHRQLGGELDRHGRAPGDRAPADPPRAAARGIRAQRHHGRASW